MSVCILKKDIISQIPIVKILFCDFCIIASLSILLASIFCQSTILMKPGKLEILSFFHPSKQILSLPVHEGEIAKLPYTDVAENVYLGYLVSRGEKVYALATTNHTPGVHEYLSFFDLFFLLNYASPSNATANSAFIIAIIATVFFELFCSYTALRVLKVSRLMSSFVSFVVVGTLALGYHYAVPMSENFIFFLLIFVPILYENILIGQGAKRITAAIWLVFPLSLACLLFGLTVAPAIVFAVVVGCSALLREAVHDRANFFNKIHLSYSLIGLALFILILIVVAFTVDFSNIYFWVIRINSSLHVAPLQSILGSFLVHFFKPDRAFEPYGSRYQDLLILVVLYFLLCQRHKNKIVFLVAIIVTAILTQWRMNIGYKSTTVGGISLGILYIVLATNRYKNKKASVNTSLYRYAVMAFVIIALQFNFIKYAFNFNVSPQPRDAAFDKANICRVDQTRDCRCLQGTIWGPQFFLRTDVRPCVGRFPTFNGLIADNPTSRKWLESDVHNKNVAFFVFKNVEGMIKQGVPVDVVSYWKDEATCIKVNENASVCYAN